MNELLTKLLWPSKKNLSWTIFVLSMTGKSFYELIFSSGYQNFSYIRCCRYWPFIFEKSQLLWLIFFTNSEIHFPYFKQLVEAFMWTFWLAKKRVFLGYILFNIELTAVRNLIRTHFPIFFNGFFLPILVFNVNIFFFI